MKPFSRGGLTAAAGAKTAKTAKIIRNKQTKAKQPNKPKQITAEIKNNKQPSESNTTD